MLFQLALAAGAPWGAVAYGGGSPGVLPKGLRLNSFIFGAAAYPVMALYVFDASEIAEVDWLPGSRTVVLWIMVAFFGLGSLANAASRSKPERMWVLVTVPVAVCCAVIALST